MTEIRPWRGAPARPPRAGYLVAWAMSLAVALAAVGLGAWRMLAHQCVDVSGPLGTLGMRLAVLSGVADCPAGTAAITPNAAQNALLALAVALPVIAAHVAVGACGVGLIAAVLRGATAITGLLGACFARVARPVARVVGRPNGMPPVLGTWIPLHGRRVEVHPLRGPPTALA